MFCMLILKDFFDHYSLIYETFTLLHLLLKLGDLRISGNVSAPNLPCSFG